MAKITKERLEAWRNAKPIEVVNKTMDLISDLVDYGIAAQAREERLKTFMMQIPPSAGYAQAQRDIARIFPETLGPRVHEGGAAYCGHCGPGEEAPFKCQMNYEDVFDA